MKKRRSHESHKSQWRRIRARERRVNRVEAKAQFVARETPLVTFIDTLNLDAAIRDQWALVDAWAEDARRLTGIDQAMQQGAKPLTATEQGELEKLRRVQHVESLIALQAWFERLPPEKQAEVRRGLGIDEVERWMAAGKG